MRGKVPLSCKNVKNPLHGVKLPKKLVLLSNDDLPQKDAKTYLPPGASCWRGNYRGCWSFHLPPHKRISESWSDHGGSSREAMLAGMRRVWSTYLRDWTLPTTACPIEGIFP